MMDHHSIIPDSRKAACDPGSGNKQLGFAKPWTPAFAGERENI